jgi:hypothetical protein
MEFIKLKNDVNGNQRVAVNFMHIPVNELELKKIKNDIYFIENRYKIALSKAKKIGGKEYRGKKLGGCFVFINSRSEENLKQMILAL